MAANRQKNKHIYYLLSGAKQSYKWKKQNKKEFKTRLEDKSILQLETNIYTFNILTLYYHTETRRWIWINVWKKRNEEPVLLVTSEMPRKHNCSTVLSHEAGVCTDSWVQLTYVQFVQWLLKGRYALTSKTLHQSNVDQIQSVHTYTEMILTLSTLSDQIKKSVINYLRGEL